ncbi:MAG: ClpXP protease specificity-enhancing factor [Methylotenera sp.]|nr:ClpXP protease specificity-enhancing factor [Methylotenera sp.]
MTALTSTKPYMVRAIHEWCVDNACTPHLLVAVNHQTRVPMAYVKEGEIVLNLNYTATKDLQIDNEVITFSARFGGVSQILYVPMSAVKGIFARETGQGMFFEVDALLPVSALRDNGAEGSETQSDQSKQTNNKKPTLTIVK